MDKAQLVLYLMWWQMIGRVFAQLGLPVRLTADISPLRLRAHMDEETLEVSFGQVSAWQDPGTAARAIYGRLVGRTIGEAEWREIAVAAGYPDGLVPYL